MEPDKRKQPRHGGPGKPAGSAADSPSRDSQPGQAPAGRERRSSYRVADDQKSGQGSLSALSKMKMLQRRRDAVRPGSPPEPDEDTD